MKKLFVCFLIVLLIFNLTAFCEETKIYTFPGERVVFDFSFSDNEDVITSDFYIKPTGPAKLQINFKNADESFTVNFKIVNKLTKDIIYNSVVNFISNGEDDIYQYIEIFPAQLKTNDEYYIEISEPSLKNAKGKIEIIGSIELLSEIGKLRNLGIANDVGEGPYQLVKRGEMAKLIAQTLKMTSSAAFYLPEFSDVAKDNPNYNYIGLIEKKGIADGYGNGNFKPDENITYYEAVKMIVCMLGYKPEAEIKGYPEGYLQTANKIGIILYPGAEDRVINLDDISKILYKAIDTPLMLQTGFGAETQYEIADGVNNKLMTIRNTYLATE